MVHIVAKPGPAAFDAVGQIAEVRFGVGIRS
jgi:hypothetical protein